MIIVRPQTSHCAPRPTLTPEAVPVATSRIPSARPGAGASGQGEYGAVGSEAPCAPVVPVTPALWSPDCRIQLWPRGVRSVSPALRRCAPSDSDSNSHSDSDADSDRGAQVGESVSPFGPVSSPELDRIRDRIGSASQSPAPRLRSTSRLSGPAGRRRPLGPRVVCSCRRPSAICGSTEGLAGPNAAQIQGV